MAALFLSIGAAYFYGYNRGAKYQMAVVVAESVNAADEGRNSHEEIERENMLYTDAELDKHLSKWMRD